MSTVVYFEFYPELQQLVFIRAPYFLLPKSFTADKVSMKSWFKKHRDITITIDEQFSHVTNRPRVRLLSEGKGIGLGNYVLLVSHLVSESPYVEFYDNDNHRPFLITSLMLSAEFENIYVGEYTAYADDDTRTIIKHGYNDRHGQEQGIWTNIEEDDGTITETLFDHGRELEPGKIYYASGKLRAYDSIVDNGIIPYYNDDTDNTLSEEDVYEHGQANITRYYNKGKLFAEFHYIVAHILEYVDVYYDSGRIKQYITPVFDQQEGILDATVEELLNDYIVEVVSYYDNDGHNRESDGKFMDGVKVDTWRYYNDDARNTIKQTIKY